MEHAAARWLCALSAALIATTAAAAQRPVIATYTSDDEHEDLVANPNASSGSCGVERWSVKTGTDPDAGLVDLNNPQPQTINWLRGLTAPATPPSDSRVQPTETTAYVVDATLVEYKLESDSDYHLVIEDAAGNTMIAEIPDPACVGAGSPFATLIQSARQEFDSTYTATTSFHTANIPVQLVGVGFFDFQHGQTGVAPNAIELHPILDVIFNPGSNANFALSASPASVSVVQGANAATTVTETPSGGFSGSVALSASGLPSGVSALFSPSSTTGSSTLTLSASATATTGTKTVTITGASGGLTHTTTLTLTVNAASGGGAQTAVYNSTLKAPWCGSSASACDSGPTLLLGRANISGGAEPNQPNTIGNSCADGTSGTFHSDESVDRVSIASADGSPLAAGKSARVTATVWVYSTTDVLDLYSAADANSPNWVLLSTITPAATGAQTLSTSFTLPNGTLQAVRANFRYGGSASPCSTGSYDDHDDLVFAVAGTADTTPPTVSASESGSSGTITLSASASDNVAVTKVEFYVDGALKATDTTSPYSATLDSTTLSNASHTLVAKAYDAAGNVGTSSGVGFTISNGGGGSSELIVNGGFESGTSPWSASSGVITNASGESAHAGSFFAWLDGYGKSTTDTLVQTVAIPSSITSATLSFWLHVDTAETTTSTAYDKLTVQLQNGSGTVLKTLATYSNLNKNSGYAQKSFDVSAYKGQTVKVYFKGVEDASLQTSFVIDDVSLKVQ